MNKQQLEIAEAALRFISVGIFLNRNNYIRKLCILYIPSKY